MKNNLLFIVGVSFLITLISGSLNREYKAVVGNLCEKTNANPEGFCYEMLPKKGFPIAFVKDVPGISVQGKIGLEDYLYSLFRLFLGFISNWFFYFSIIYLTFKFLLKSKI